VIVFVTEWDAIRALDLKQVKEIMRDKIFVDLRNVYDPEEMRLRGFKYVSIGCA